MRILIEEYPYDAADVHDELQGLDVLESVEGKVVVRYVGYFYNNLLGDCVFILPKVMLKKDADGREKVFGKYEPRDIVRFEAGRTFGDRAEEDFVYKFAVWIYRAIVVYKNDARHDSDIVYQKRIARSGHGRRRLGSTYLDILLALIQWRKDNRSFFFYVLRNLHSGLSKINWTRTIAHTPAIVQEGSAVYLNPVNRKRQVNFDEELLVIYSSILHYIAGRFGFAETADCNVPLITGRQFDRYLGGYGKVRLGQIKYKYFSDKALQLWQLCYAFFDESRQVMVHSDQSEYLLVGSFHVVFEAIIDALIGDETLPDGMDKKQEDGKIVDHLYTARSLIESESRQTYYIGDSKYYKMDHELGRESIYKQYTYARNVIQWNLDIFNGIGDHPSTSGIKLCDDVTEGYNIIPNFFISAKMNEAFDYTTDDIEQTDRRKNKHVSYQWRNRLFDRDTLLLFHYDVNFLFVLSLYARNDAGSKAQWKKKIRERFRTEIQEWLQQDYDFYAMRAHSDVDGERYVRDHFKELLGKVYTPYADPQTYSLALDKADEAHNAALLATLRGAFYVEPCALGTAPDAVLPQVSTIRTSNAALPQDSAERNVLTCLVRKMDAGYDAFACHKGRNYIMERVPSVNLMAVRYLLPMVRGSIDGYYDLERIAVEDDNGQAHLRIRVGAYHALGTTWVSIYRSQMQPGELISLIEAAKLAHPASDTP